eukprot:4735562-Pyramimonas_sp.AAC.1
MNSRTYSPGSARRSANAKRSLSHKTPSLLRSISSKSARIPSVDRNALSVMLASGNDLRIREPFRAWGLNSNRACEMSANPCS